MEANQREKVGVIIAATIIIAYIAVGFIYVVVVVIKGQGVIFPSDWTASMLSLASAALGFLIGKQTNSGSPVAVTTEGEKPLSVQAVPPAPVASQEPPIPPAVRK